MPLDKERKQLTSILQCPLVFSDKANQIRHQLFRELLLLRLTRLALPSPPPIAIIAVATIASITLVIRQATLRAIFF